MALVIGLALGLVLGACVTGLPDGSPVISASAPAPPSQAEATTEPGPTGTAPALPSPAGPSPNAPATPTTAETRPPPWTLLDASGGPIEGQIGTFQWAGITSDSPLLRGRSATVGPGQELALTTTGPVPSGWRATLYVDPTDRRAVPFGEAAGPPRLQAPPVKGEWTLALEVHYPAGEVLHFWRLTVPE